MFSEPCLSRTLGLEHMLEILHEDLAKLARVFYDKM